MSEGERAGPLAGIRVIDLTRILAGPFCTMNLGDMGAEVIKVEQPDRGDDTRGWGPPFAAGESAYFLAVNRNKRSITLNLKHPRGQELLQELLRGADVLVENFKPGTLEAWGITPEWRERETPQLVHCEISGYGNRGPCAGLPGYDFLLQAESGLMSVTGEPDGEPTKHGVAIVDISTGMYAAMGILAALTARHRSGRGQKLEVSLYASSIALLSYVASNHLVSGKQAGRFGNGHPNIVPYRPFDTANGQIAVAVGNDSQFARLADCLGYPEWADDDRFRHNADRVRNREQIDGLIAETLQSGDSTHWIERLQREGIPCSPINSVDAALAGPQTRACEMIVDLDHPTAGSLRTTGVPFRFSQTPASIDLPPPTLGADTDTVLQELLGLDQGTIESLRQEGVVQREG